MATPQPLNDRATSDTNVLLPHYPTTPRLPMVQSLHSNNEGSGELTAVVDELLNQLNTKFTTVSSELLSKSKSVEHYNR